MNKLLREPVLVRNFYFPCSGAGFLLFLSFLHRKLAIQICFCKVAGENGKKLLPETIFKSSKSNLPHGCFHNRATF